jgi:O-antigen/teichoic acid export membrane protein
MTYLPSVTRNTVTLFLNRILISAVNFLVGIIVIRHLGADRFGMYSVVFAFLSFFSVFTVGSGVDQILVREVSKGGTEEEVRRKTTTAIFLRLLLGTAGVLIAFLVSRVLYGTTAVSMYIMVSAFSLAFAFHESNSPFIIGYNTRLQLFVPQIVMTAVILAFATVKLFLVYWSRADVLSFILADAAAPVVISIAYWILYRKTGGHPIRRSDISMPEAKYLIRESAPLLVSSLFIMLYMRIDQILISKWLGSEALGNYSVAVRISEIFNFVPAYLAVSMLPVFTKTLGDGNSDELYEVCFRFLNLFIFPVILFFTLFSGEFLDILFPGQFPEAAGTLRVLIWSEFFIFAGVIHSTIVLANGLQRYYILFFALQAVLNLLLNWLLIPRMSIVGAAWASVASYGAGLLLALFVPKVGRYTRILFRSSRTFLFVALAVTAIFLAVPGVLKMPLGIVGVALLFLTGSKKKDLAILSGILNELRFPGRQT